MYGKGLYRYTFEGACRECPELKLEDGAVRVFINTKGTNREDFSQEFLDFMDYVTGTTDENAGKSGSVRIKTIHKKICRIRKSERAGIKLMQRWEELEYAKQDGRKENAWNAARRMVEDGKLTLEKIAEYAGLSYEEVKNIKAE